MRLSKETLRLLEKYKDSRASKVLIETWMKQNPYFFFTKEDDIDHGDFWMTKKDREEIYFDID